MDWIDLALATNEPDLQAALGQLNEQERERIMTQLCHALELSKSEVEQMMLRLLIERARPIALPAELWARKVDSSADVGKMSKEHLKKLHMGITEERLRGMNKLYGQFAVLRETDLFQQKHLENCNYRCVHCGLAFCNDELTHKGWESPHGTRPKPKKDDLKPQWHTDKLRLPSLDHEWGIRLYGGNGVENLRVLCRGCNEGKQDYLAAEQTRPGIGLPHRDSLLGVTPISTELFYAQLRFFPRCYKTDASAADTELTVEIKDPLLAPVLGNLVTVESPGL